MNPIEFPATIPANPIPIHVPFLKINPIRIAIRTAELKTKIVPGVESIHPYPALKKMKIGTIIRTPIVAAIQGNHLYPKMAMKSPMIMRKIPVAH